MSCLLFSLLLISKNSFQMRAFSAKRSSTSLKSLSNYYKPKSYNQKKYCEYLNDWKIKLLFAIGPAGTGKTMLACNTAIKDLQSGNINKIILTRPVVPVEEDIGFLPGNINKKMDPWTRPIFDIFLEFYSQKDIDSMIHANVIEIAPLGYMRGRTFKNAFIIADEMQNSSPNQMLMLTTRIGEGSKMVITGDLKQSDKGLESGLYDFIRKFNLYEKIEMIHNTTMSRDSSEIKIVEMNNTDIERSPVIEKILDIYNVKPMPPSIVQIQQPPKQVEALNNTTPTYYRRNQRFDNDCAMDPRESWLKD
uniref:PhoH-like protein n=1 Tax=viral metagenome TaxID=1070528 RepID=A0A6C0H9Y9_9ZZZZ